MQKRWLVCIMLAVLCVFNMTGCTVPVSVADTVNSTDVSRDEQTEESEIVSESTAETSEAVETTEIGSATPEPTKTEESIEVEEVASKKLTKISSYDQSGEKSHEYLTYNAQGRLAFYGNDIYAYSLDQYLYNYQGQLIERETGYGGIIQYEYDEVGRLIKSREERSPDTILTEYTYNSFGDLTGKIQYIYESGSMSESSAVMNAETQKITYIYEYDERGKIQSEIEDYSGLATRIANFDYSYYPIVISKIYYDYSSSPMVSSEDKYQFSNIVVSIFDKYAPGEYSLFAVYADEESIEYVTDNEGYLSELHYTSDGQQYYVEFCYDDEDPADGEQVYNDASQTSFADTAIQVAFEGTYDEFLNHDEFLNPQPLSELWWVYKPEWYTFVDVDQNGVEEMVILSGQDVYDFFDLQVYGYDRSTNTVYLISFNSDYVADSCYNGEIKYSADMRALVYNKLASDNAAEWRYCTITSAGFSEIFSIVWNDNDFWKVDAETPYRGVPISEEEYQSYLSELVDIDFISIDEHS